MTDESIKPKKEEDKRIRIVLADVSPLLRQALRAFIEKQQDMEVIGEAGDGEEAIEISNKLNPDIVIMDIDLPRLSGIEAIKRITKDCPSTKILVLTVHNDNDSIYQTVQAGASGFLMKNTSGEITVHVARRIAAGEKNFPASFYKSTAIPSGGQNQTFEGKSIDLTPKELEILKYVARGEQNKQIAHYLGLSLPHVKYSLTILYTKLGASSRVEAISLGLRYGLISFSDLVDI